MDESNLMKQLLESGVHFGHQTKKWNPKMKPFIFGERNGIYIIDLQKTAEAILKACSFLKEVASKGGYILFVGTKKQAQDIIKLEAESCGTFYVNQRWLGGLLTNFQTVRKSIKRMKELERMKEDGTFLAFSKKEASQLGKELNRLKKNLDGVKDMNLLPSAIFVIDSKKEDIAVKEVRKLGIPVVALVDTNCDPDMIDYPIPGNDDAIKSIKFITSLISSSVKEGKSRFTKGQEELLVMKEKDLAKEEIPEGIVEKLIGVDVDEGEQKEKFVKVKRKSTAAGSGAVSKERKTKKR